VAIATFCRSRLLREAIESIMIQSYRHLEILVRDDGNDLKTEKLMADFVKRDRRIQYEKNAKHLGISETWTCLLGEARGEYVMILGDDDRLMPDGIAIFVENLAMETALVFSNHYVINERGERTDEFTRRFTLDFGRADLAPGKQTEAEKLVWRNAIPFHSALFRTDYARQIGFRKDLNTPDFEFLLRFARVYPRFIFEPRFLTEIRYHTSGNRASGLENDRLVEYLMGFPVVRDIEPLKRTFIGDRIANAVSRLILSGKMGEAKSLFRSSYYSGSRKFSVAGVVQFLALHLPPVVGERFYRFIYQIKHWFGVKLE